MTAHDDPPAAQGVFRWSLTSWAVPIMTLAGCIIEDSRCGEHQVALAGSMSACVCEPGFVKSARGYGCEPCGANEVASNDVCTCAPGFQRSAEGSCLEQAGSHLGQACSPDEPCSGDYPFCATDNGESYCTQQGCASNATCPNSYLCELGSAPSFCKKTSGLLKTCTGDADCAGTHATYCEAIQSNRCIVQDCATNPSACPSGWACCDLRSVLQRSLCVPSDALQNGVCFDGKAPVGS
jgi:hypothetical protein